MLTSRTFIPNVTIHNMVIIYQKGSLTLQQKVYSRGTSNKSLFIWEFRGSMELGLKSGISAGFGNAFLIRTWAQAWLLSQELSGFRVAFRVGTLSLVLEFFSASRHATCAAVWIFVRYFVIVVIVADVVVESPINLVTTIIAI